MPGTESQLAKMFRGQRTMPPTNSGKQQFSQLPRIGFGRVVFCPKIAQGFAHYLAGIGVAPGPDFLSNEVLEVPCQCHLHGCIFPRGVADVNWDAGTRIRNRGLPSGGDRQQIGAYEPDAKGILRHPRSLRRAISWQL